jgi:hypothetical protein
MILKNEKSLHINLYSSLYFLKLGITNVYYMPWYVAWAPTP